MQLKLFDNGKTQSVVLNHTILQNLLEITNFKNITCSKSQEKKSYLFNIDQKILIVMNQKIQNDEKQWNYLNIHLNLKDLIQKYKYQVVPKKIYKSSNFYQIAFISSINYDLQKAIEKKINDKQRLNDWKKQGKDITGAKKGIESTSIGFVKDHGFDGTFFTQTDQDYLMSINKFYQKIQESLLPKLNPIIVKNNLQEIESPIQCIQSYENKSKTQTYLIRCKFQEQYMSIKDRDSEKDFSEFVNEQIKMYQDGFDDKNGLFVYDKEFKECKEVKNVEEHLYNLQCPIKFINKDSKQKYNIQLFTSQGIINLFKDLYPKNQFTVIITPKFQFGTRTKGKTEYTKFDCANFILSILNIQKLIFGGNQISRIKQVQQIDFNEDNEDNQINEEQYEYDQEQNEQDQYEQEYIKNVQDDQDEQNEQNEEDEDEQEDEYQNEQKSKKNYKNNDDDF